MVGWDYFLQNRSRSKKIKYPIILLLKFDNFGQIVIRAFWDAQIVRKFVSGCIFVPLDFKQYADSGRWYLVSIFVTSDLKQYADCGRCYLVSFWRRKSPRKYPPTAQNDFGTAYITLIAYLGSTLV